MKVLRNHYNNKPTIFVNGLIINGCQTFTLSEAEDVFSEYNVIEKHKQDVHENYIEKSTPEEILSFINDEDWRVRAAVANQGYGLDKLINDKDWDVRAAVAKQGYGLDILINDKDRFVRAAVARQGYGLDILINDKYRYVREAVARQGYGLDVLVKDEDPYVREIAKEKLNIK